MPLENRSDKPLAIIEVQCGDYVGEDDIVRFDDQYEKNEKSSMTTARCIAGEDNRAYG